MCVPKIMIRLCMVPEIWCVADGWRDGQTDRKSDIEVGAPPKNIGYMTLLVYKLLEE